MEASQIINSAFIKSVHFVLLELEGLGGGEALYLEMAIIFNQLLVRELGMNV